MLLHISNKYKSPNFDNRRKNTKIKYIIIHYTETKNLKTALKILCDPKKKVSCHFIIDLNGKIYKLVDESKNAWHAGLSYWKKNERLNDRSIGIEIVNDGITKFNDIQIRNLILLLKKLVKNFGIDKLNILGHSDIAPTRKKDPGIFFPWEKLQKFKFGLPLKKSKKAKNLNLSNNEFRLFLKNLKKVGFSQINIKQQDSKINKIIINSFHRHFYIERVDKSPDKNSLEISNFIILNSFNN